MKASTHILRIGIIGVKMEIKEYKNYKEAEICQPAFIVLHSIQQVGKVVFSRLTKEYE